MQKRKIIFLLSICLLLGGCADKTPPESDPEASAQITQTTETTVQTTETTASETTTTETQTPQLPQPEDFSELPEKPEDGFASPEDAAMYWVYAVNAKDGAALLNGLPVWYQKALCKYCGVAEESAASKITDCLAKSYKNTQFAAEITGHITRHLLETDYGESYEELLAELEEYLAEYGAEAEISDIAVLEMQVYDYENGEYDLTEERRRICFYTEQDGWISLDTEGKIWAALMGVL